MADTDFYYPFDSINGDRKTTAATERRFWSALFNNGVIGSNAFPITSTAEGVYSVGAGVAVLAGAIAGNTASKSITARPEAGKSLYIVLRLNTATAARKVELTTVSALTQNTQEQLDAGGVYDLPLYKVDGQGGGAYGLLDVREYCTSFDAAVFSNKFNAQLDSMMNAGEKQLAALMSQFSSIIAAADAENAGLYGSAGRQGFINPTFTVNQRGQEAYSISSGSMYTFDHWKALVSGKTLSNAMSISAIEDGTRHALKVVTSPFASGASTVGRAGILQNIENGVRTFCTGGRKYTVSFDAKADSACKIGIDARKIAKSGGTGVDQTKIVDISSNWKRYSVTFEGDSGVSIDANANDNILQIGFFFNFVGYTRYGLDQDKANTIYFANMQINEGESALPCYVKPYAEELEDCQRYYVALGAVSLAVGSILATNNQVITCPVPITRRLYKYPTATFTDRAGVSGVASAEMAAGGWRAGLTCALSNLSHDAPVFVVTNLDVSEVTRVCFNSLALEAEIVD